jgi:hypothetical protein
MLNAIAKRLWRPTPPNAGALSRPDFRLANLVPDMFREAILQRGAVMLRGAGDPALLRDIKRQLGLLFAKYSDIPDAELERHLASSDPIERDHWEQIKLSHIYDRTFKEFAGYSYFDTIERTGLWELLGQAFPEASPSKSAVCTSRRITNNELHKTWDSPLHFHVDAQFFYDHCLSVNFWTPLDPCGVTAPGLQVVLLGVQESKEYLEHNPAGYDPGPNDIAIMSHFRCGKMDPAILQQNGLDQKIWAPEFAIGDVLVFTNFTMHATHYAEKMANDRTSVEVRVDLPSAIH